MLTVEKMKKTVFNTFKNPLYVWISLKYNVIYDHFCFQKYNYMLYT